MPAQPRPGDGRRQEGHRARHARVPAAAQRRPPRDPHEHDDQHRPPPAGDALRVRRRPRRPARRRPQAALPAQRLRLREHELPEDVHTGRRGEGGQAVRARVHRGCRPQALPADHRRRRLGRQRRPLRGAGQEGGAATAGHAQRRSRDRRHRGRARRRRQRAGHRPDGPGRPHHRARRQHRVRPHAHHAEPRGRQPAVLGRAPGQRPRHARPATSPTGSEGETR